jgi:hypothetical protein
MLRVATFGASALLLFAGLGVTTGCSDENKPALSVDGSAATSLTPGRYGPGDAMSTGETIVKGAFVNSADLFISTATPKFVEVKFNGRTLKVPNWPSDSVGISVVLVN